MEQTQRNTKAKILRILLVLLCIAAIFLIAYYALNRMLPGFLGVLERGDETSIEEYIRSCGSYKGMLIAFLLQFFQIISIFFPGGPIQIAIGIIFGTWQGFFICHVGYVSANALVFFVARRLGSSVTSVFSSGSGKNKLSFITKSKHPAFVVSLACLMPFLPNGLVPYVAAMTKIRFWAFFLAVWAGSIPCLLLLCTIGGRLLKGDYLAAILFCALLVGCIILLYCLRKQLFALADRIAAHFQNDTGSEN